MLSQQCADGLKGGAREKEKSRNRKFWAGAAGRMVVSFPKWEDLGSDKFGGEGKESPGLKLDT